MRTNEFCYWLQGYFELGGDTLTTEQIAIVKAHVDLVFKYLQKAKLTPDMTVESIRFCYWLADEALYEGTPDIQAIKSELNKCFLHEIDQTYGDAQMQNELNAIHGKHKFPPEISLMRC